MNVTDVCANSSLSSLLNVPGASIEFCFSYGNLSVVNVGGLKSSYLDLVLKKPVGTEGLAVQDVLDWEPFCGSWMEIMPALQRYMDTVPQRVYNLLDLDAFTLHLGDGLSVLKRENTLAVSDMHYDWGVNEQYSDNVKEFFTSPLVFDASTTGLDRAFLVVHAIRERTPGYFKGIPETLQDYTNACGVVYYQHYPLKLSPVKQSDGYAWGYLGTGPAALAAAMLHAATGDETIARQKYQNFMEDYIAQFVQGEPWALHKTEVCAWLAGQEQPGVPYPG